MEAKYWGKLGLVILLSLNIPTDYNTVVIPLPSQYWLAYLIRLCSEVN